MPTMTAMARTVGRSNRETHHHHRHHQQQQQQQQRAGSPAGPPSSMTTTTTTTTATTATATTTTSGTSDVFGYVATPGDPPPHREVLRWLQRLAPPLPAPLRSARRDLANGRFAAEVLLRLLPPGALSMHSFDTGESERARRANWELLCRVADKHGLPLDAALVEGTRAGAKGAAVSLLEAMFEQHTKRRLPRMTPEELAAAEAGLAGADATGAAAALEAARAAAAARQLQQQQQQQQQQQAAAAAAAAAAFGDASSSAADSGALRGIAAGAPARIEAGPATTAAATADAAALRRKFAAAGM